jgi:hypothetical protein
LISWVSANGRYCGLISADKEFDFYETCGFKLKIIDSEILDSQEPTLKYALGYIQKFLWDSSLEIHSYITDVQ